jgi:cytochrome c2
MKSGRSRRSVILLVVGLLVAVLVASAVWVFRDDLIYARLELQHDLLGSAQEGNQQASTRYVDSSLLGLEVTTVDLSRFVPPASTRSGAIALVDGRIVVADADGRFYEVRESGSTGFDIGQLATRLDINAAPMLVALERRYPDGGKLRPGRVTDLLYVAQSGDLYVAHTYWHAERQCSTVRVSSIKARLLQRRDGDGSPEWALPFESKTCLPVHNSSHEGGGRLVQISDRELLLTLGSFAKFEEMLVEPNDLGKIVRIALPSGDIRQISWGHRNPQGLTRDPQGRIWSTEHGPQGGDELNLILEGRNYGWPLVSFGTDYGSKALRMSDQQGRHDDYEKPRYAWIPSIGVSNLVSLTNFHERWNGDLLVTSLIGRSLHRLRLDEDRVVTEERIVLGERLRDILESDDGTLYLWTDNAHLLKIRPDLPEVSFSDLVAELRPAVRDIVLECATCHGFERGSETGEKISLYKIYGKPYARGADQLYSQAFLAKRGKGVWWDDWHLDRFLEDPQIAVPGSTMSFGGVKDPQVRQEIIAFLRALF